MENTSYKRVRNFDFTGSNTEYPNTFKRLVRGITKKCCCDSVGMDNLQKSRSSRGGVPSAINNDAQGAATKHHKNKEAPNKDKSTNDVMKDFNAKVREEATKAGEDEGDNNTKGTSPLVYVALLGGAVMLVMYVMN